MCFFILLFEVDVRIISIVTLVGTVCPSQMFAQGDHSSGVFRLLWYSGI